MFAGFAEETSEAAVALLATSFQSLAVKETANVEMLLGR